MPSTTNFVDAARVFGPPVAVAAVSFFFAWFQTRRKMLFSDAHGSRWDVVGLALAGLVGIGSIIGWTHLLPPGGLGWLAIGLAAILGYLMVAAGLRFREATDSVVICLVALASLVLALRSVPWVLSADGPTLARVGAMATVAAIVFAVAMSQSFLTWRLEAFDFFLINVFQSTPAVIYCAAVFRSADGARTLLVSGLVMAVGLLCTLARRRLQLTMAFGLLYGFFVSTVVAILYFSAEPAGTPRRPTESVLLIFASLVVPAILAAFPAIAEDRKRARLILPTVTVILAATAVLVSRFSAAAP